MTPSTTSGPASARRGGSHPDPLRRPSPPARAPRLAGAAAALAGVLLAGCGSGDVRLFATPEDTPQSIQLTAVAIDERGAAIAWSSAGNRLTYRLERNGTALADTGALGYTDRALVAGQRYCWRVVARSGFGWQARSNEACLGTAADTTAWRVERLAAGRWPAVALDAADNVHVCWTGVAGAPVQYLQVGPGRAPETVDADGTGQCSLAVDAEGRVHVAHLSRFGLRHAVRESGRWRVATVDAQARVGQERFDGPALALAADGAPRIAYRRLAASGAPAVITVATRVRDGWTFDPTGLAGLVGPRSLAVATDGASRLAVTDELGEAVTVARRDTSRWVIEVRQTLAPTRGDGPPIALDRGGAARIAWWQRDSTATSAPITLRWSAAGPTGWQAETIAAVDGVGTRVAIAGVDTVPRVAVVDVEGTVRLFSRESGRWTVQPVDGQGGAAAALDFAIDRGGQWRLVFDRVAEGSIHLASRQP